jgi:hypothetical protein
MCTVQEHKPFNCSIFPLKPAIYYSDGTMKIKIGRSKYERKFECRKIGEPIRRTEGEIIDFAERKIIYTAVERIIRPADYTGG